MSGLETGAAVLRRAAATPITSAVGRPSGVDGWLGRRVGEFVLDDGTETVRKIQAYLPQDPAKFQYVSDLPTEAVTVGRRGAVATRHAQVALEDARTGAWHVAGLVDQTGAPIRVDELGAIRQSWNDARFDTNHVDAGGVFGEAHDFPLRDDIRRAIDELDFEVAMDDMPAVSTDSAQAALTAATRSEVTAVAPMRAAALDTLPSQAIEPVATFGPVDGIPGYLSKVLMTHPRRGDVVADITKLRATSGTLDDVRKLARRYSIERGGQQIAAFETAPDRYLLAPLRSSSSDAQVYLDEVSGLLHTNPEARFVTGPGGGVGSGIGTRHRTPGLGLDPARAAQQIRKLSDRLSLDDDLDEHVTKPRAVLESNEARIAQIDQDLRSATFRERGRLRRERQQLDSSRYWMTNNVRTAELALEKDRAEATSELARLTSFVERMQLPEREEWVALSGFTDGTPRLRDLTLAEPGVRYGDLVRAARQTAFGSDSTGRVVLRANDGAMWTGTFDITPDGLLGLKRVTPYATNEYSRPTAAIRAITVGGRTVQWDDAGAAVLA